MTTRRVTVTMIDRLQGSIDYLISRLALIEREQFMASQQLEDLRTQVERSNNVMDGAATLLGSLAAKIEELKDDPVALQGLADSLRAETDELATAVTANTPAEEPTGPTP